MILIYALILALATCSAVSGSCFRMGDKVEGSMFALFAFFNALSLVMVISQ